MCAFLRENMAEIKTIKTDVVVIGAGIAGLWLANILKNNGINFVLLETDAIGANQTINSQGMLHSGIKYALQGNVTGDMKAISDSEALHLWEQAFLDQSSIKLTENCKLIDHQYLWSNNQLTSKLANFFVSNLLKSKVEKVAPEHLPVPFINKHFNGSVYKLHETVLNLSVLLQELTAPIYQYCLQVNNINLELEVNNNKINKFFIDVNGERFLLNLELLQDKNVKFNFLAVLSILSIFDLENFIVWRDNGDFKIEFFKLNNPDCLDPQYVPLKFRERIWQTIKHLNLDPVIVETLTQPDDLVDLKLFEQYNYLTQYFERSNIDPAQVNNALFVEYWTWLGNFVQERFKR